MTTPSQTPRAAELRDCVDQLCVSIAKLWPTNHTPVDRAASATRKALILAILGSLSDAADNLDQLAVELALSHAGANLPTNAPPATCWNCHRSAPELAALGIAIRPSGLCDSCAVARWNHTTGLPPSKPQTP